MRDTETRYRFERWFGREFGNRYALALPNEDLEDRIQYFYRLEMNDHLHLVAVTPEDIVIGVAALQQNPRQEGELWLQYVSVDPAFRNQGIGRKLFTQAIQYAQDVGKTVELSYFEEDGLLYLSRATQDLQRLYPGSMTRIPIDLQEPEEVTASPDGP